MYEYSSGNLLFIKISIYLGIPRYLEYLFRIMYEGDFFFNNENEITWFFDKYVIEIMYNIKEKDKYYIKEGILRYIFLLLYSFSYFYSINISNDEIIEINYNNEDKKYKIQKLIGLLPIYIENKSNSFYIQIVRGKYFEMLLEDEIKKDFRFTLFNKITTNMSEIIKKGKLLELLTITCLKNINNIIINNEIINGMKFHNFFKYSFLNNIGVQNLKDPILLPKITDSKENNIDINSINKDTIKNYKTCNSSQAKDLIYCFQNHIIYFRDESKSSDIILPLDKINLQIQCKEYGTETTFNFSSLIEENNKIVHDNNKFSVLLIISLNLTKYFEIFTEEKGYNIFNEGELLLFK